METTSYFNFDLLIQPVREGYRARVQSSPVGEAWESFALPGIADFSPSLAFVRSNGRGPGAPEMFGAELYKTVFHGQVGSCLARSLDAAERESKGLRIRLRLNDVPELARLPWEYLHDPASERSFVLSHQTPIVRYLEIQSSHQPLELARPLRVLMVIANPYDFPALNVEQEWEKVQDALSDLQERGFVVVKRLPQATWGALQNELRQEKYHILHFIGHGWVDGQQSGLVLEDAKGRGDLVRGSVLGTLLRNHRSLRLALLNACEGARMSDRNAFAGTAQRLVLQGLPSVIAMQFPISDQAAIALTHEFYKALADGYPVDGALGEARQAIYGQQRHKFEWGTPVLFMRAPDGRLFEIEGVGEDAPAPGESPYKGLHYFEEQDAERFFGREELVGELVSHLQTERFLAVVGASGSGKSSLVRAGLIPALRRGEPLADDILPPAGSQDWPIHVITPTADPLEALAASLTRDSESVIPTDLLIDDFLQSPRALHLHVRKLLSQQTRLQSEPEGPTFGHLSNSPPSLLLVIDQFEELFTLCKDSTKRETFVQNVLTAVMNDGPTVVLITLRADFYAQCAQFDELRGVLERQQKYIGSMKGPQLREAIEGPARQADWKLEPGLVEQMLRDVGSEPGALPLLSHALLETWTRRRGRTLTFAGYAGSGGVHGAIAHTAEYILNQRLNEAQQAIARTIFLQLTELGEGTQDTRRRVPISDLLPPDDEQEAQNVQDVLQILANARLITTDAESAEVAHEALIREWPTLGQWLDEDREGLRIQRQLNQDAQQWLALNRDSEALYRGVRLAQALEWAETYVYRLNTLERRYLGTSKEIAQREEEERQARLQRELEQEQALRKEAQARQQAEQERAEEAEARRKAEQQRAEEAEKGEQEQARASYRLRRLAIGLALMFVAALGIASYAYAQARIASEAEAKAEKQAGIAIEAQEEAEEQARVATVQNLVALSKNELDEHPQRSVLLALEALDLSEQENKSPVPVAEETLREVLVDVQGIGLAAHEEGISVVAMNDRWLATGSHDHTAALWDLQNLSEPPRVLGDHEDEVQALVISPDNKWLVTGSYDGTARVWDLRSGSAELREVLEHTDAIRSVAITDRWIVTGSLDKTARLWDLDDLSAPHATLSEHEEGINSIAISPKGRWLITTDLAGVVLKWDLERLKQNPSAPSTLRREYEGPIEQVAISPENRWLVVTIGNLAYLSGFQDNDQPELRLEGHQAPVRAVAFSPQSDWLVTGSNDKTARLWNLRATDPSKDSTPLEAHQDVVRAVAFSPDGRWLVTASYDQTARLWDLRLDDPSANPLLFKGHDDELRDVAFSSDGEWFVTAGVDGRARLHSISRLKEHKTPYIDGMVAGLRFSEPVIIRGHQKSVRAVAISSDNHWLATGSAAGTVHLWNLQQPEVPPIPLPDPFNWIDAMAITPDNHWLVTAGLNDDDRIVRLWELTADGPSAEPIDLKGHKDDILAITANADKLLAAGYDGMVYLWNLTALDSDQKPFVHEAHKSEINAMAITPDSERLVTADGNGTIKVWDLENLGSQKKPLEDFTAHEGYIWAVAISPDGRWLASGGSDNKVLLWNLEDLSAPSIPLTAHGRSIAAVAISPDNHLVTADDGGTTFVWDLTVEDLSNQQPIQLQGHKGVINSLVVSSDGRWVVTGSDDQTVRLSHLGASGLMEVACRIVGRNLSPEEWGLHFKRVPHRKTCPNLPSPIRNGD
ncbi:MAG: CHAT domain-containing protein [Ardenticatenaceae bacterium]